MIKLTVGQTLYGQHGVKQYTVIAMSWAVNRMLSRNYSEIYDEPKVTRTLQ